jgi:cytochrome c553
MSSIKRGESTMNIRFLIAALVILLLAVGTVQAGGDAANGQALSEDCAGCHGDDGKGDEDNPPLAGLGEAYQVEQLKAFASGERVDEDEMMGMYAEDLSEQDMADLAAYYATLK